MTQENKETITQAFDNLMNLAPALATHLVNLHPTVDAFFRFIFKFFFSVEQRKMEPFCLERLILPLLEALFI